MENNIKNDQLNWQIFSVIMPFKYDHPFVYINLNSIIKQNKYIKDFFLISDSAQERVKKIYEKYLIESEIFDRFMIIDSPYIGPGAARDHGAKKCAGEYIAFIELLFKTSSAFSFASSKSAITLFLLSTIIFSNLLRSFFDHFVFFVPDI